jgi:hypothetical protein
MYTAPTENPAGVRDGKARYRLSVSMAAICPD